MKARTLVLLSSIITVTLLAVPRVRFGVEQSQPSAPVVLALSEAEGLTSARGGA
jgi:hypothetical protein